MREFRDFRGNVVEIPETPERIVSLSPAITETLFDLSLDREIAGVSAFCRRPEKAASKRKIGSYGTVNRKLLDELKPDLILGVSGYPEGFLKELSSSYPTVVFELPRTIMGILDMFIQIGGAVNRSDEAHGLVQMLIEHLRPIDLGRRITYYLEIDLGGPVTFGRYSYITDTLSYFGFESIYSNADREWLQPSDDRILSADPDVVIYEPKMFSGMSGDKFRSLVRERGWDRLTAYSNDLIFKTPGDLDFFAHHGPSFFREVIPWIKRVLAEPFLQ